MPSPAFIRVIILEFFIVCLGMFSLIYGAVLYSMMMSRAGEAKSYDQTHRCVATVVHDHLFWVSQGVPVSCGWIDHAEGCMAAPPADNGTDVALVLAVLKATGKEDGDCRGVHTGVRLIVTSPSVHASVVDGPARAAIGQVGQYHARFSASHGRHYVYNVSLAAPAINNTLAPAHSRRSKAQWMGQAPVFAMMIWAGCALFAVGMTMDINKQMRMLSVQFADPDELTELT